MSNATSDLAVIAATEATTRRILAEDLDSRRKPVPAARRPDETQDRRGALYRTVTPLDPEFDGAIRAAVIAEDVAARAKADRRRS